MHKKSKNFVYFRCALPMGTYPDEAKPLAERLADRLRSCGVAVDSIQKNWEDLRIVCRFQGRLFWLDLTTYVEAQPPEFSLEINPAGRKLLSWFRRPQTGSLIALVDEIMHAEAALTGIRWHRPEELKNALAGTDHPFA